LGPPHVWGTLRLSSWVPFENPFMHQRNTSRPVATPALLAALLLLAMLVLGGVWHTHSGVSSDTCQICHVSHQPAAQELAVNRVTAPIFVETIPLPADASDVAGPSIVLAVPRAPPTA
jgi:hypothetical protein